MRAIQNQNKMEIQNKKKIQSNEASMTSYSPSITYRAVRIGVLVIGVIMLFTNVAFAGDLFTNASQLLTDVYARFVAFSTAAAGVGVGTGVFMKKLSFGKQERIELGNKVIRDSLIGWSILNGLGMILAFLSNYTK